MERLAAGAHDAQTEQIILAALAVHRELGCGFLEVVYRRAFSVELRHAGVPMQAEARFPICYKGTNLGVHYRADFVCFGEVIVEVKAHDGLGRADIAQALNYLKASGLRRALVINFGRTRLECRRLAR
ncbi:MAG: GxxExxY protein [Vicinamibacterales bacterium]